MNQWLDADNFPSHSGKQFQKLSLSLKNIMDADGRQGLLSMMAIYAASLSDRQQAVIWPTIRYKIQVLFRCGAYKRLDGPFIGMPLCSSSPSEGDVPTEPANSDYLVKNELWHNTFRSAGVWMGKTFEPISKADYAVFCSHSPEYVDAYNPKSSRVGRNFFRNASHAKSLQKLALPALQKIWKLEARPKSIDAKGVLGQLTINNLEWERMIPYDITGGNFLANGGHSVLPGLNKKQVYQLNYRWPRLNPVYPLTRLLDEVVQIDDGLFLGQLLMASRHYSTDTPDTNTPSKKSPNLKSLYKEGYPPKGFRKWMYGLLGIAEHPFDYDYKNLGFFLLVHPKRAPEFYAQEAFLPCAPQPGEMGYTKIRNSTSIPALNL